VTADRPYVDRAVVDRPAAQAVAEGLADRWDLGPVRLLRHGMNSLFAAGPVVLRVGRATAPASAAHELAGWLLGSGIPTVLPVDGLTADVAGFAVTGWQLVDATTRPIDWVEVGSVVRRVHDLDPEQVPSSYPVPAPTAFPWWDFGALLDEIADLLDDAARSAMSAVVERHADWRREVVRRPVLCHGDVHPGNVMMSATGVVLVDWDLLCVADRGWDHAMLTTFADRWGGDPDAYQRFAEGYGVSLAGDPLTIALGELRNVAATLMRVRAGRSDPVARSEAGRRLAFWRGESDDAWRAQ
jgi:aminoglycoside phosphotransferase